MSSASTEDSTVYNVVVNHEEQYSIWPDRREIPTGWRGAGVSGPKAECLSYIDKVWTDMRPLSLRKAMEEQASAPTAPEVSNTELSNNGHHSVIESLPVRLSKKLEPIELILRPEKSKERLVKQIKTGCVHVRFTGTRGGTDLPITIEPAAAERLINQIADGAERLQLQGELILDYVPARCTADVDLASFTGTGKLDILSSRN